MRLSLLWAVATLGAGLAHGQLIFDPPKLNFDPMVEFVDLKERLSPGAQIYVPTMMEYHTLTNRWSAAVRPHFEGIVAVKNEYDVYFAMRWSMWNLKKRPFLAISGAHGQASTLNNMTYGVGIYLRGLNSITIADGGTAVWVGGGVQTGELVQYLWNNGKQTVAPGCDCTGIVAPLLGGGHGWLQGRYGLMADQLIEAQVYLDRPDGITIINNRTNPDLFWALRGAGHNFGIVTKVKMRIYDRSPATDSWTVASFTFTQDKLEQVFAVSNEWLRSPNRPVELTHFIVFMFNPAVDATKPVIVVSLYYQGASIPPTFTNPLYALNPVSATFNMTDLTGLNAFLQAKYGMANCQTGMSHMQWAISLSIWPIANLRQALNVFATLPQPFRNSVVLLEAYSTNAVTAIPDESTAYPDRAGQLLIGPTLNYPNDASLDDAANRYGNQIRQAIVGTGPLVAYVNYARGDENTEQIYGSGRPDWRVWKLRKLKAQYDPDNRFSFYNPIRQGA